MMVSSIKKPLRLAITLIVGLLLGASLTLGVNALKAAEDSVSLGALSAPQVIPYDGFLELDGRAVTGPFNLRFSLYDSAEGEPIWQDAILLPVYNGRFAALLGSETALPEGLESVFRREALLVGVDVEDPDSPGSWSMLSNRQRLLAVPHAYLHAEAEDFLVERALAVAGNATLEGDVTMGTECTRPRCVASQHLFESGLRTDHLIADAVEFPVGAGGGVVLSQWAIYPDGESLRIGTGIPGPVGLESYSDRLSIADDGSITVETGSESLTVNSSGAAVSGTLTVTGDLTVSGAANISGSIRVFKGLTVGGALSAATSDITVNDGGLSAAVSTLASVVVFIGTTAVTNGATFEGVAQFRADVDMSDADEDPIHTVNTFVPRTRDKDPMDELQGSDLYVPPADRNCFIGGFSFLEGDWNEHDDADLLRAFSYLDGEVWTSRAEAHSHNTNEEKWLGVVCLSDTWSRVEGWFSTDADGR